MLTPSPNGARWPEPQPLAYPGRFRLTQTREQLPAEREWVRSFWQALQPHASGIGTYVNTMVEFDEDRIRASYGPDTYARLAEIKRRYDPENLFHLNANIKPAG